MPGSMFSAQFYEYLKFVLLMVSIAYLQFKTLMLLAVKILQFPNQYNKLYLYFKRKKKSILFYPELLTGQFKEDTYIHTLVCSRRYEGVFILIS